MVMNYTQKRIWEALCELDGETVARLFTDWLGNQVMDEDFYEFLENEGVL